MKAVSSLKAFKILERLPFIGVFVLEQRRIIFANQAVERILGWSAAELWQSSLSRIFSESARDAFIEHLSQVENNGSLVLRMELPCLQKNGQGLYCSLSLAAGDNQRIVVSIIDGDNGNRDGLTGLYKREPFFVLAEHEILVAKRQNRAVYFLFVDIDGLKETNDYLGHAAGDKLIKAAADILKFSFRSTDIISRFGGDEFVVLAIGEPGTEKIMIKRIRSLMEEKNRESSGSPSVSLSVGITRYDFNETLPSVIDRADELMYREKKKRRKNRK